MMEILNLLVVAMFGLSCTSVQTDTLVVESTYLGRTIEVTTYATGSTSNTKHVVYMTDGQKMLNNGALNHIKTLTHQAKIPEAYYVFVSTVDKKTGKDHRNTYFFCNEDYLKFFEEELIPLVEARFLDEIQPKNRGLIGISFGGLNAAYFSARSGQFRNFGLLSPVTYPRQEVLMKDIAFSTNKGLKIYLSSGTNDAENYIDPLQKIYTSKGYDVKVVQTKGGHDFTNWNAQWEALLGHLLN